MSIKSTLRTRRRKRRILWVSLAVVVLAVVIAAYLVAGALSDPYTSSIGQPASPTLTQELAGFSSSTLSDVGAGSAKPPSAVSGGPLTGDGRPLVLYIGGEYCPYCAVTRWSLVIALSKFGTFSGLEYMLSSGSDVNANTPTFTFASASYTSPYVTFVAVEHWDRSENTYQPLTSNESALYSQYDSGGGIPFVDFANRYLVTGVTGGLSTLDLSGMNWTQVYSQLTVSGSQAAQAIIGEANYIISTVCAIDGNRPSSVCSLSSSSLSLAAPAPGQALQTASEADPGARPDPPWTA